MKLGDLVKYKDYHKNLQHLRGVVYCLRKYPSGDRVRVFWNSDTALNEVYDWVEDLELVIEGW